MLYASRLVIAAPQGVVKKLQGILDAAQIGADAVCFSGQEALEILQDEEALLLTTVKLDDMTGAELAERFASVGREAHACASLREGVALARELAGDDGVIVAAGSLYLMGELRTILALPWR